jgi:hypothetical protein
MGVRISPARRRQPVTTTYVMAAAWETALILAFGDPRRLQVLSATEVLVRNRPVEPGRI